MPLKMQNKIERKKKLRQYKENIYKYQLSTRCKNVMMEAQNIEI